MKSTADVMKEFIQDAKLGLEQADRNELYVKRYEAMTLVEMATVMKEIEGARDRLEELGKYINAAYDALRLNLIPTQIEAEGLESPVNVAGVGKVILTGDLYVSVGAAEPEAGINYKQSFYDWLHKHHMGDLITETINPSTLKAWVKGRIKEGKEYPTECLKVAPFTRASITKPRA